MIRRYLREHLPLAGLLALFAGTFALVLSLYHLPTEPVAYASALCAVMGLIALIWGFVRYRRAHQARAHVLNAPHLLLDELPSPRTLSEADDQAIMQRLLHDVRAAQSDLAAYRQDSTDYFTAWVHQIKTPLSVMRLQLQSEDTPENRAMLAELFQMEQYVTMALSYARLGNPTKDLVLTRVPLDPLIRQAIRDFAPLLIRKKLRLLNLGDEAMALLREHGLCEGYAQALLRVPGIQGRLRVLRHVIEEKLSVPDTERLVSDVLARMPVPLAGGRHMKPLIRDYRLYVNAIRGVVEQMRDAGLDARMQVNVGQRVAEVRIDMPMQTAARLGRR